MARVKFGFTPPRNMALGTTASATDSTDFTTWLSTQGADIQAEYYAAQAANPSDLIGTAGSFLTSLPTWAKLTGAGLLAVLVLLPHKR